MRHGGASAPPCPTSSDRIVRWPLKALRPTSHSPFAVAELANLQRPIPACYEPAPSATNCLFVAGSRPLGDADVGPVSSMTFPPDNLVFAVLALAHDDLLVRTVIMPKFQLSVGLI
jgi:hypothetical protein